MSKDYISVITPFYKGNRFMDGLFRILSENTTALQKKYPDLGVEFILVNDSPEETVVLPDSETAFEVKVVNHPKNSGIHQARITGLSACRGFYVQFLDQDDELSKNALLSQYEILAERNADVVVANGYLEGENGQKTLIFAKEYDFQKIGYLDYYLKSHNVIKSPGQVLIKKAVIPEEWQRHIMKTNGSDDLFLWILLLSENVRFEINRATVYTHKFTGENLSESNEKMTVSSLEFLGFLKEIPYVENAKIEMAERSRKTASELKKRNGLQKIPVLLKNGDLIFQRVLWKLKTICSKRVNVPE